MLDNIIRKNKGCKPHGGLEDQMHKTGLMHWIKPG